jgi:hypothetical protein
MIKYEKILELNAKKIKNKERYYYIRQFEISLPIDTILSNNFLKHFNEKT